MRKIVVYISFLLTVISISCSNNQAEYKLVGEYEYKITNDSLFNETYLTEDSFGYVIGGLEIQGLKINGIEKLDKSQDYIISINHPIKAAYINSEKIQNEGYETKLKPLDVIRNEKVETRRVYIYLLRPKGKYRLITG